MHKYPEILDGKLRIGAQVRFVPSVCQTVEAGLTNRVKAEVVGTVIQIHALHRWYRVEYEIDTRPVCIGHECFKIIKTNGGYHENNCNFEP